MSKRRYNEQQIGAILQRSGEIQAGLSPESDGLTLEELQRVAQEVGIEPHVVEQAALEVDNQAPQASRVLDHTVDGEVSDEQWEDIVMRLRQYAGKSGTSTVQGSTREWTADWEMGSMTLTASTRNGRTRLRLLGDTSGAGIFAWMIGLIGGFLGVIVGCSWVGKSGLGALAVILTFLTIATTCFFLTRTWARAWKRKSQRNFVQLFSEIVAKADPPALRIPAAGVPVDVVGESGIRVSESP